MRSSQLITHFLILSSLFCLSSSRAEIAAPIEKPIAFEPLRNVLLQHCFAFPNIVANLGFHCQELKANSENWNTSLSALDKEKLAMPMVATVFETLTPRIHLAPPTEQQTIQQIVKVLDGNQPNRALHLIEQAEKRFGSTTRGYGYNLHFDFLRARALTQLNDTKNAILLYQKITAQHPELPDPWNNLGVLYFTNQQIPLAIDAFNMALRIDPQFKLARQNLIEAHRELANVLEQRL